MRRRPPERRPPDRDEIRLLVKRLLRDVRHPDPAVIAELKAACGDPAAGEMVLYFIAKNPTISVDDLVDRVLEVSTPRADGWTL